MATPPDWHPRSSRFGPANRCGPSEGFSPQEIGRATRSDRYRLGFVDGLHTNEQMVADLGGVRPILDQSAVVVFHDVALTGMPRAWDHVVRLAAADGYKGYPVRSTQLGVCALARGLPEVDRYPSAIASDFGDNRYPLGIPPQSARRPRIWTRSPYEWELSVRRRLASLRRGS